MTTSTANGRARDAQAAAPAKTRRVFGRPGLRCVVPAAAALACGMLGISCGPKATESPGSDASKPPPAPAASTEPATPAAEVPLEPIGLVDNVLHKEPGRDAWQGEVFNDLAGEQLKALGKILAHPADVPAEALESIVETGTLADGLVPVPLEVVFDDGVYRVSRPTGTAVPGRAANAAAAFRELVAPLADAGDIRSKFKVFSVALDAKGEPTSEVYFQISGTTGKGIVSRQARWRCRWNWTSPESAPKLRSIEVSEFEETLGRSEGGALFEDCTAAAVAGIPASGEQFGHGMDHWAARLESRYGIGLAGWHGLALGDVNGDGLDDVYVCEPGGLPNRLLVHVADGSLIDASSLSGTDFRLQTQSALFVDLDNDGDQDLVLATTLGVILMANDGRGNFVVKASRLVAEAGPVSVCAADFDLDGDLDLYVGCYSLRNSNVDGVQILGRPIPYHDANNGGRNLLLRNDRDWRFTEATLELGLDVNNRRFTLAASWEDYDGDGDPDLYVANDYGRNNLYRNDRQPDGSIRFVDAAREAGVEDISAGMSVSWADADNDGDRDLYVSNMWSSAGNRIAYQRNFQAGADAGRRAEFQRHARGNSLFLNNGDGTFADASVAAGVTMGRWAWGSRFADLNNDGSQDIVVANGFISQPDNNGDL
ncbi:MAG: FG-GAP repeat domain-containing protein [Verrucomicrobiales bacterium]